MSLFIIPFFWVTESLPEGLMFSSQKPAGPSNPPVSAPLGAAVTGCGKLPACPVGARIRALVLVLHSSGS